MFDELRATPEVLYGAVIAFVIVVLLTPAVGGMARMLGAVDRPDARRINRRPIPRLGGLAIFLGILVPALAFLDLSGETRGVLLGAAVATVVGAVDDFRGLSPSVKLIGQFVAASIPCMFGVWIDHVTFPFLGVLDIPAWIGVPLSMLFIVAVMNMVNFLDGLDGLAAGVCGISGVTYAILALSLGKPDPAILSAIVAGACLGFLRHNFFPARIFMGDSGALCLGFILAAVSIQGLLKTASTVVLLLPLLVLAVPIMDTSFVVARRLKHSRPIYTADRSHLHHRFLNIGFSQRRAAVTMWLWCASLAGAALATRFVPFREGGEWHLWETLVVVAIGLFAVAFSIYVVYLLEIVKLANPRVRRRDREPGRAARADDRLARARAFDEVGEPLVELGMALDGVAVAWRARRARPVARASRTSQIPSKAGWWRPETTSFGKDAAASVSRGISASHGPRSTISACAPCSSSGGSGGGGSRRRADGCEEPPQECLGVARSRPTRRAPAPRRRTTSTAGSSRGDPCRRRLDHRQRADQRGRTARAASSETTPPYE